MKSIYQYCVIAFFGYFMQSSLLAQRPDSSVIKHSKLPFTEKVYLHLDRHYYSSHEDIWFKAYLVNAANNIPSVNSSKTLYAEPISPDSKLVAREVLRMDSAIAIGEFKLSDSIPSGKYRVRAYTKWMLNFDDAFIFEKEIEIQAVFNKVIKAVSPKVVDNIDLRFFPEGGSLVEGIMGFVAFKASNITGKDCEVKGSVISSHGDTITMFESSHLGMGKFVMIPQKNETYYAIGTAKNIPFRVNLPSVVSNGFAMAVTTADTIISISINTNEVTYNENKDKNISIEYTHAGYSVMKQVIPLIAKNRRIKVSKLFFPSGLTRITLYDPQHRPQCDQLVYIEPKQKIHLTILTDHQTYKPREKVLVKIKATDNLGNPVKTNLSFSATDGDIVPSENFNIESYLMLESELRGKIEQPLIYFDTTNHDRFRQLDLLLLTQGWSSYIWRHFNDTAINIKHIAEQGLSATGYVRRKLINTPVKDAKVSFIVQDGNDILRSGKTDTNGKFDLGEVKFYGMKTVILSTTNSSHESIGWALLDSMYLRSMYAPVKPVLNYQIDTTASLLKFAIGAGKKDKVLRKYRHSDTIMLNEVKISSEVKHSASKLEKALQIQSADSVYRDLEWYLGVKYPYIMAGTLSLKKQLRVKYTIVGLPDVNQKLTNDIYDVKTMSMKDIKRVEIYKGWSGMELDSVKLASGKLTNNDLTTPDLDDIIYVDVYLRPGAFNKRNFATTSVEVTGYYRTRMFYSTDHGHTESGIASSPDLRSTIDWAPNIVTNEKGEASFSFFNADQSVKIRTLVEGITEKGQPVTTHGSYNIKDIKYLCL